MHLSRPSYSPIPFVFYSSESHNAVFHRNSFKADNERKTNDDCLFQFDTNYNWCCNSNTNRTIFWRCWTDQCIGFDDGFLITKYFLQKGITSLSFAYKYNMRACNLISFVLHFCFFLVIGSQRYGNPSFAIAASTRKISVVYVYANLVLYRLL